jgi:hypothetical protein
MYPVYYYMGHKWVKFAGKCTWAFGYILPAGMGTIQPHPHPLYSLGRDFCPIMHPRLKILFHTRLLIG